MSVSRFLIGDSVTVVKAMPEWDYWISAMDDLVGETGVVANFEETYGGLFASVEFKINDAADPFYPMVISFLFPDEALQYADNEIEILSPTMSVFNLVGGNK